MTGDKCVYKLFVILVPAIFVITLLLDINTTGMMCGRDTGIAAEGDDWQPRHGDD